MLSVKNVDIRALQDAYLKGVAKPKDVLVSQLNEMQRLHHLNAFISQSDTGGLARYFAECDADSGLYGIPFSAKDNLLTYDFPTTVGSALLQAFQPQAQASIVSQLVDAGAFLMGKNNMPEFCQSMTANNPHYGAVKNPLNTDWIAGGSSSGGAAAVAAGIVSFAIGTDTGGSVCIPAALCGCVGYRPSIGRYPNDGLVPVSPSIDVPGLIAKTVADIRLLDSLLTSQPNRVDKALDQYRIGIPRQIFCEGLDQDVADMMAQSEKLLQQAGIELVDIDLSSAFALNKDVGFPIAFYEMLRETSFFLAQHGQDISLHQLLERTQGPTEKEALRAQVFDLAVSRGSYVQAIQQNLPVYRRLIDAIFTKEQLDAIVFPTTPITAIEHRPLGADAMIETENGSEPVFLRYIRNLEPFSNYGGPCMTLPAARSANAKAIGLGLAGFRHKDSDIIDLAASIESAIR